jgi:hypothetical protein
VDHANFKREPLHNPSEGCCSLTYAGNGIGRQVGKILAGNGEYEMAGRTSPLRAGG